MVTAIGTDMAATKGNQIVTSVYLDRDQYEKLQELSDATGAPMAHWIRTGVDTVLKEHGMSVASRAARKARKPR
jgi:predicted DNA-binding protein